VRRWTFAGRVPEMPEKVALYEAIHDAGVAPLTRGA